MFNQIYWSRIEDINQNIGVNGFAVTISAIDLAETERKQELIYLYASIILLIITIILIFAFFRMKKLAINLQQIMTFLRFLMMKL